MLMRELVVAKVHNRHQLNSTRRPVGATPGSIQSIAIVCVNWKTISSTMRSSPTVRETSVIAVSGGICGISAARKFAELILTDAPVSTGTWFT